MRRLAHSPFTLRAAASLLLCVVLCPLWVATERSRASEYRALQQALAATTARERALDQDFSSASATILPPPYTPAEGEQWGKLKMKRLIDIGDQRRANWAERSRLEDRT